MIGLLLAVTVTFHPAAPTIGDHVTVRFPAAVSLDRHPSYEIVSVEGSRAVVRTFRPAAMSLRGRTGAVRFANLAIPVLPVVREGERMRPEPLVAPRPLPRRRTPSIAIAVAALIAAAAWSVAWRRSRARAGLPVVEISPDERFRQRVAALRRATSSGRWAALADETRRFLGTHSMLGSELTTAELLSRLRGDDGLIGVILSQGDLEKFSPWGARPLDFDDVASRALALAPEATDAGSDAA